ncbi:DUF6580 family putative transport protein [Lewinella sp. 4G2]|uniref:DUF6580 family putative transport protein n=1 Tax=Lewinella sp. 4G2 TaxID=1803372 RepID=UPI0007E20636|nr:DUF6580 family putative transport protein [Lewinella sp. 4G2]OAV46053.1 hypothetical protein A3850_017465 [Lewinella sp. 4G2]
MPKLKNSHLPLILVLIVAAVATRLLPHPPNFVPVGAMALFGAAALPKKWMAVLVPLAAFYLSDLVLNNVVYAAYFEGLYFGADPFIYGGILLMVLLGLGVLRSQKFNWLRIGGAAIGATAIFFLLSNFGVWVSGTMYPKTAGGLGLAYVAGLPFLLNSLLANLVFSGILFGAGKALGVFNGDRLGEPAYATSPIK